MIVYYSFSGVIADLALAMNIILILAAMALIGATLTLPGIAGIALTIGIAVDANVLIYERIREELRLGKTPRAAVDTGYQRATITIMDANVTSAIAALVLYNSDRPGERLCGHPLFRSAGKHVYRNPRNQVHL